MTKTREFRKKKDPLDRWADASSRLRAGHEPAAVARALDLPPQRVERMAKRLASGVQQKIAAKMAENRATAESLCGAYAHKADPWRARFKDLGDDAEEHYRLGLQR